MNNKDLSHIDNLIERLDNLPDVLDIRIKVKWEKISEEEYDKMIDAYKELDDLLNDLLAFINVKFPNRNDLIYKWNKIDFDPKIAGMKIETNSRELITKNWKDGLYDFKSLMKNIRREILILLDNPVEKETQDYDTSKSANVISYSNVFFEKVSNSKIENSNNASDETATKTFKWQKWGVYTSIIIAIITIIVTIIYSQ